MAARYRAAALQREALRRYPIPLLVYTYIAFYFPLKPLLIPFLCTVAKMPEFGKIRGKIEAATVPIKRGWGIGGGSKGAAKSSKKQQGGSKGAARGQQGGSKGAAGAAHGQLDGT